MTFGNKAAEEFGISTPEGGVRKIGKNERCNMCQMSPILSISHGLGMPSLSIFLHEVKNYWNMQFLPMLNSSELVHRVV